MVLKSITRAQFLETNFIIKRKFLSVKFVNGFIGGLATPEFTI